jgi:hypothetical protein
MSSPVTPEKVGQLATAILHEVKKVESDPYLTIAALRAAAAALESSIQANAIRTAVLAGMQSLTNIIQ